MTEIERLAGTDLSMLWPDDLGWPQDIGGLAIVERRHFVDAEGELRLDELRSCIEAKLPAMRHFRQVLRRPGFGCGRPFWVDDARFSIDRHVRQMKVPEPATESQLVKSCEMLRRRRFDTSRPLWEIWFVTGLEADRMGIFVKVHHALADGAAGVAALAALFDLSPDAPTPAPAPWTPNRPPTRLQVVIDHLLSLWGRLRALTRSLGHPRATLRRLVRALSAIRGIAAENVAPRLSFNRPIGDSRRLAVIRSDLDRVRAIAHLQDGTVNDVLLAVIAGGLRDLLLRRGELDRVGRPRAVIPIAGRPSSTTGNATASSLVVPLIVHEPDAMKRLEATVTQTRLRKQSPLSYDEAGILHSPLLERLAVRFAGRQRVANVYVANLPGPPTPFYLASAPILELIPVVPLVGNIAIGIGALSYAGQFNLTVVADRDLLPDIDWFVNGVQRSFEELGEDLECATTPSGGGQ